MSLLPKVPSGAFREQRGSDGSQTVRCHWGPLPTVSAAVPFLVALPVAGRTAAAETTGKPTAQPLHVVPYALCSDQPPWSHPVMDPCRQRRQPHLTPTPQGTIAASQTATSPWAHFKSC